MGVNEAIRDSMANEIKEEVVKNKKSIMQAIKEKQKKKL
jgi:hypothetical protein